jgi:O-antigen ligase
MQNYFNEKLLSWQFQPIHSLFLLILIETGVVGFGLWILFFMMLVRILFRKNVPRGTQKERAVTTLIVSTSLFMVIVSFFDHYFWDIQQGQLLLWLLFGVFASKMK